MMEKGTPSTGGALVETRRVRRAWAEGASMAVMRSGVSVCLYGWTKGGTPGAEEFSALVAEALTPGALFARKKAVGCDVGPAAFGVWGCSASLFVPGVKHSNFTNQSSWSDREGWCQQSEDGHSVKP